MTLLLDANLSWRLISVLKQHFDDCLHVNSIGLKIPPTDAEIWNYAKDHNLLIVTNDDDFADLVHVKGFPPKVLLFRIGNHKRIYTANLLIQKKEDILAFFHSPDLGLLEIIAS
ncbi:DUF5615 family PIN-like protein [Dinghuibacter silviterrae]|uniref:Putative nuclease of predicted toxin-antitoxin system n=1 Tax=Dinghuibacter silviterrae TaxID=1539049 RepID=A0A4R8DTM3_9BACT|nr:DUF5615 family PIN-like protein [Dinghuibacter silviterrae]TDX00767.1 putative nuclease of predicted toxin-antitoxin system [Dinghuibacter silviterrae]